MVLKWLPRGVRKIQRKAFREHLLLTNTILTITLDALGDYLEQRRERIYPNDWGRTSRMGSIGLLFGPLYHYWYVFLDRKFPGKGLRNITYKIALDEAVSPLVYSIFFPSVALMEGKSLRVAAAELKAKLWPTVKVI